MGLSMFNTPQYIVPRAVLPYYVLSPPDPLYNTHRIAYLCMYSTVSYHCPLLLCCVYLQNYTYIIMVYCTASCACRRDDECHVLEMGIHGAGRRADRRNRVGLCFVSHSFLFGRRYKNPLYFYFVEANNNIPAYSGFHWNMADSIGFQWNRHDANALLLLD
jgi:hypothetical protein